MSFLTTLIISIVIIGVAIVTFFLLKPPKGTKILIQAYGVINGRPYLLFPKKKLFGYNREIDGIHKFIMPKKLSKYALQGIKEEFLMGTSGGFPVVKLQKTAEEKFKPISIEFEEEMFHFDSSDNEEDLWYLTEIENTIKRHEKKKGFWENIAPYMGLALVGILSLMIIGFTANTIGDMYKEHQAVALNEIEEQKSFMNKIVEKVQNPQTESAETDVPKPIGNDG